MFYGLASLIGCSLSLHRSWVVLLFSLPLFLLLPLTITGQRRRQVIVRSLLALTLAIASFGLTNIRYTFPDNILIKGGVADIDVISVSRMKTPFGPVWSYKGNLRSFVHDGRIAGKGLPVQLSIPYNRENERPLAGVRYKIPASLKTTTQGRYVLSSIKGEAWKPVEDLNGLAELRSAAKFRLTEYLKNSIKDPHTGAFLAGIVTGEFDDRFLSFELGRFGLQHLMAISGLHFSIFSGLFGFCLFLCFPRKVGSIVLIILMTGYFLFLGDSPSVTRSWLAIVIALGAVAIGRRSVALNSLGMGLLLIVLLEPLSINEIGFQFSFGVTASILLWFSPCSDLLQKIFPKRTLSEVLTMDRWDQHAYCLLHWLKQALALGVAVNMVALPLTLYHFHKFPFMALVYNLFFPPLVTISMFLLILGLVCSSLVPWVGDQLHHLNESYTGFLLNTASHLPKIFDTAVWRVDSFQSEILLIYLFLIFGGGIVCRHRIPQQEPWMIRPFA